MKRFMISATLAAVTATAAFNTTASAADLGVTIAVGEPGFYGVIQLGDYPRRPHLIYDQPIIVEHRPYHRPPLYLHVPPAHIRNWQHYCRRYHACGDRVYFVNDDWYNREYVPYYRSKHRRKYHHHKRFEKHHRPYHWSYDEDREDDRRDRRDYDDRDRRDWDKDRDRRDYDDRRD